MGWGLLTAKFHHTIPFSFPSARWQISERLELNAGVHNLLDEEPRLFGIPIDQNTDPSTFDTRGHFYFASLRMRL